MSTLETAIRAQEGKLTVSKDHLLMYERQRGVMEKEFESKNPDYHIVKEGVRKWRDEVNMNLRVLQTLREVAGQPADAPVVKPVAQPTPEVKPEPAQQEVKAQSHAPFQQDANERHLLNAIRKAKSYRVGIPLSPSYANSPSAFEGQALKRTIADHPDFERYVSNGGCDVLDSLAGITIKRISDAAKALGLDPDAIRHDARCAYFDIITYGESGRHYRW